MSQLTDIIASSGERETVISVTNTVEKSHLVSDPLGIEFLFFLSRWWIFRNRAVSQLVGLLAPSPMSLHHWRDVLCLGVCAQTKLTHYHATDENMGQARHHFIIFLFWAWSLIYEKWSMTLRSQTGRNVIYSDNKWWLTEQSSNQVVFLSYSL